MNHTPLVLIALFAAAAATPARAGDPAPTLAERSDRVVEVRGLSAVAIDDPNGRVELAPSADARLHVQATKICRARDMATAHRLADGMKVFAGPEGGRYVVRVECPHRIESTFDFWDLFTARGRRNLELPRNEVQLRVEVPAGLQVEVRTVSGDVIATGLAAGLAVHTTSGDLSAHGLRGPLTLTSTSGDAELGDVQRTVVRTASGDLKADGVGALEFVSASGDAEVAGARDSLRISTESGDVTVGDAPAGLRVDTASGDVTVRGACGSVRLRSESGSIEARLRGPLREADVGSISGDLDVAFVTGLGATLETRSTSGSIDCRMPVRVLRHGENSLDARLGSGGARVRLHTTSGNVSLTSEGR